MAETKTQRNTVNLVQFLPEQWPQWIRFTKFYSTTYCLGQPPRNALRGIDSHLIKANTLYKLAVHHAPNILEDEKDVQACGYSPATRSKEITALLESVFCELYSSLDCMSKVLGNIYAGRRGVPKKSTHRFFERSIEEGSILEIPEGVRATLANASFFQSLQTIRTSIAHYDVGMCFFDKSSEMISYMCPAPLAGNRNGLVADVFGHIFKRSEDIVKLLNAVFAELNASLCDHVTEQMCGFFGGRPYTRLVRPSEAVDFHGGICKSHDWFEKPQNPRCPFADRCGAYSRVQRGQTPEETTKVESAE